MTLTAEEDFAGFVAARWPDLEAVALVATLDPGLARETTAESFADLRQDWREAVTSGAPTAAVRRALLARLVSAPGRDADAPALPLVAALAADQDVDRDTTPAARFGSGPGHPHPADEDDDRMTRALLAALADHPPIVRAALGAQAVWQVTPDELAGLLGRSADAVLPAVLTARALLLSAHRATLAADGLTPRDDRLAEDLAAVVARLADDQPDPTDPAALVADRARRVHRRNLLVGGGAVVAAGAAAWWTLGGAVRGSTGPAVAAGPTGGADRAQDPATDPDAELWRRVATWPGRGILASDYGMQALVARQGPAARLVYADDVEDVRVVVGITGDGDAGIRPLLWAGSVGAPGEQLVAVPLGGGGRPGLTDVLAVGVPHPTRAVLLVLTDPRATGADFSPVVHPTPAGSAERTFQQVRLENGIGRAVLLAHWGAGAQVRVDGGRAHSVPPPVAWRTDASFRDGDVLDALVGYVASVIGVPRRLIVGSTLVDSVADGSVLDPDVLSATGGDGRVLLVSATTPDRAVVRGLEVTDDGRAPIASLRLPPTVVPAGNAGAPALLRLVGTPPDTGRFLVVLPDGGATVQLLATTDRSYPAGPVSNVVPTKGRTAVVPVVGADLASAFRLVVTDAEGRTTYDAVPPAGRDLLDPEHGLGWLGLPPDATA